MRYDDRGNQIEARGLGRAGCFFSVPAATTSSWAVAYWFKDDQD